MKKLIMSLFLGLFLISSASAFDWTDNLDRYYALNGSTIAEAVLDYSGYGQDATNNNFVDGDLLSGILNNSLHFEGVNQALSINNFSFDSTASSISFWFNATVAFGEIGFFGSSDRDTYIYLINSTSLIIQSDLGGDIILFKLPTIALNEWNMLTLTRNSGTLKVYLNGTESVDGGQSFANPLTITKIGAYASLDFYKGRLDEISMWNRTLSQVDINVLYNSGNGLEYEDTSLSISLNNPSNDTTTSLDSVNFSATIYPAYPAFELINATLNVWYENNTILIENTTSLNGTSEVQTDWNITNLAIGNYIWNVRACQEDGSAENCTSSTNRTFAVGLEVKNSNYDAFPLETAQQELSIDVFVPSGVSIQTINSYLVYNGTSYSTSTTSNGNRNYTLSRIISTPLGESGFNYENRSFYWKIILIDENTGSTLIQNSSTYQQNVTELVFGICQTGIDVSVLNFTLRDEETQALIDAVNNATTFKATFFLGADSDNLIKNYTITNQSTNKTNFAFCTNNEDNEFFVDMESTYSAASYSDRNYYLNNASLSNSTNLINLFLLLDANALEFFIDIKRNLNPLASAVVNIDKYFIGEGLYKTIEIDETDVSGEITSYLDLDEKYKFTITKDGEVLGIFEKTAFCEAAPCTISLSITDENSDAFASLSSVFAENVLYNLSFNPTTSIVTFQFIDVTGLANYFRMVVYQTKTNQSSVALSDQQLYTSSGTMTFNVSGYEGDFRVDTFISRSPEKFIDFITFLISSTAEQLGTLGLIAVFLIIMVIIFGLSFKPSMLVLSVPLSISVVKIMGILSLSNTSIIIIYILGGLAFYTLSK